MNRREDDKCILKKRGKKGDTRTGGRRRKVLEGGEPKHLLEMRARKEK